MKTLKDRRGINMKKKMDLEEFDKVVEIIKKDANPQLKYQTTKLKPITSRIITNRFYENEDKLRERIEEYLNGINEQTYEINTGRGLQFFAKPPTMKGLKIFLGVSNTEFARMKKEYPDTFEFVIDYIEDFLVTMSNTGILNNVATMFNLKNNHGYTDKVMEDKEKEINIFIGHSEDTARPIKNAIPLQNDDDLIKALSESGLDVLGLDNASKRSGEDV